MTTERANKRNGKGTQERHGTELNTDEEKERK
jgi:hypothetical protein